MGLNGQIKDELLALSTGQIYYSKDEPKGSEADTTRFSCFKAHLKHSSQEKTGNLDYMQTQSLNRDG